MYLICDMLQGLYKNSNIDIFIIVSSDEVIIVMLLIELDLKEKWLLELVN